MTGRELECPKCLYETLVWNADAQVECPECDYPHLYSPAAAEAIRRDRQYQSAEGPATILSTGSEDLLVAYEQGGSVMTYTGHGEVVDSMQNTDGTYDLTVEGLMTDIEVEEVSTID